MSVRHPLRERFVHTPLSRLQAIADALPIPVAYVDVMLRQRFANRAWETWFGRGGALDGTHLREVLDPHGWAALSPAAESALAGHRVEFDSELATRNRAARSVVVRCTPDLQDAEVVGVTITIEDVTERRRTEQALRDAARSRDEFLASLAHELRNPLAPIRNAVSVLQLAEADRGMAATARAMIERQLRQLVRLIDDLLDVSRIAQGRLALERERVDLAAILQQALETCRPQLETKQHSVHVIWPQEPLCVHGDRARLTQVFANLLSNSAKYSEAGGQITIAAMREAGHAVVKVADAGVGIAPEQLAQLFEMHAGAGGSGRADGLRIGLALARRLAELHGGGLEAASEGPGKGSVFTVRLPLASREATDGCRVPEARASSHTPRDAHEVTRVLVVDDNHDAAASLALLLDLHGYEVRTAADGVEALRAGDDFEPHVVLLDIGMPRLDGFQAAREIRMRPWGRHARLLAVTGWDQDEDRRRAIDAGFDRHLTKPVDPALLQQLLDKEPPSTRSAH